MSWFRKLTDWLGWETVRARDEKGRFVADDKSTPDVNEAYTTKTVKKKAVKKAAPKKRGRPKKAK